MKPKGTRKALSQITKQTAEIVECDAGTKIDSFEEMPIVKCRSPCFCSELDVDPFGAGVVCDLPCQ
eukprot:2646087-Amphidinium_carterae.1